MLKKFNIRVYGILINQDQQVLLSDERIEDFVFTKFPGGGLEWGEGIEDALKREWREEVDVDIQIKRHFYTTGFFQVSAFDKDSQIISIYYLIDAFNTSRINTAAVKNAFDYKASQEQRLRWCALSKIKEDDVTLPIDKHVVTMLLDSFKNIAN